MDENLEIKIERAYNLATSGKLPEALIAYEALRTDHPNDPRILATMGGIMLMRGQFLEAIPLLKQTLSIDPNQEKALSNLSAALYNTGNLDEALTFADRAINIGSKIPQAYNNRGIILSSIGRFEEALATLEYALELAPDFVESIYNKGTILQKIGNLVGAKAAYKETLEKAPDHQNARFNLAAIEADNNDCDSALGHLNKIIDKNRFFLEAHLKKAEILSEIKLLDEALSAAQEALNISPNHTPAQFRMGEILLQKGEIKKAISYLLPLNTPENGDANIPLALGVASFKALDYNQAIDYFNQALDLDPQNPVTHNNIGLVMHEKGQYEMALEHYKKALEIQPDFQDTLYNLPNTYRELGRLDEAIDLYNEFIKNNPKHSGALINKGGALERANKFEEALDIFEQLIIDHPDDPEPYFNASSTLTKINAFEPALRYINRALKIDPDYVDALYMRSLIFTKMDMESFALIDAQRATKIDPQHGLANYILTGIYARQKKSAQSVRHGEIALKQKPGIPFLRGNLIHQKMQISDWRHFTQNIEKLHEAIDCGKPVCQPFDLHSLTDEPEYHRKSAEIFYTELYKTENTKPLPQRINDLGDRIHVAYISSDIGQHPVANLLAGIFEHHNKKNFKITVISLKNQSGEARDRIFNACESFINAEFLTDEEVIEKARQLKIDIAVDLNGYTSNNRTGIFSGRVAPIQINYIGFLGTMGSDCHDYIIGDQVVTPLENEEYFTEKIIQLPVYQANDNRIIVPELKKSRSDYGLPEDSFIFCSFNGNYKITPDTFSLWMKILRETKNTALWLHCKNESAKKNLRNFAKKKNVDTDRLIFVGVEPYLQHLSRQRLADLFLDTFPYNAGATASNALYCGLPLVTLKGKTLASRYGASLLTALKIPELITASEDEYLQCCITLSGDREAHKKIKHKLHLAISNSPLFNTEIFTNNLEKSYSIIFQNHLEGRTPEHVTIS